jgi:hypothetical protein
MYDITRKVIFTHFPKTGGTTIEAAFGWHPNTNPNKRGDYIQHFKKFKHASLGDHIQALERLGQDHRKFFKFTCVRNPWDIIVSRYFHDQKEGSKETASQELKHLSSLSFDDYVQIRLKYNWMLDVYPFVMHHNEMQMDFVIRYENYKQDSEEIYSRFGVGIPLENYNTKSRPPGTHYRDLFTRRDTIDRVKNAAKTFIDLYGYEF